MRKGKWATASFYHIDQAYKALRAANPEMTCAAIISLVSREHYPFAERSGFAYQAFLKVLNGYAKLAQHRERYPRKEVKQ